MTENHIFAASANSNSPNHKPVEAVLLSIDATCQVTDLSRTMINTLMNSGVLKTVKIGRRRLITADSVRALATA